MPVPSSFFVFPVLALGLLACQGTSEPSASGSDALRTTPTQIVKTETRTAGSGTVIETVTFGFSDSSFDYPGNTHWSTTRFCFTGSQTGVCSGMDQAFGAMQMSYGQGAHDSAEMRSCTIAGDVVNASYRLFDDYGTDWDVERTIARCSEK